MFARGLDWVEIPVRTFIGPNDLGAKIGDAVSAADSYDATTRAVIVFDSYKGERRTMRKPGSMRALENFGRVRLSANFFMRDFLYSEIAGFYGLPNIPTDPDLAIAAGTRLCEELLEPLQRSFGRIGVRSGFRSREVAAFGNARKQSASVEANRAYHIWDMRDKDGLMGAAASVVVPWFADRYRTGADWRGLAWWIHDHLPYSHLEFYPKLCAFNILWSEKRLRRIDSFISPKGCLTRPGMTNHDGDHTSWYQGFPELVGA